MIELVLGHFHRQRIALAGPKMYRYVAYPGAYETLRPIEVYVVDLANDSADESSGDVESPTGWFARIGKWVVLTDSSGFHYAYKHATEAEAVRAYEVLDADYCAWMDGAPDVDYDYQD